jgi:hypothetical protein
MADNLDRMAPFVAMATVRCVRAASERFSARWQ